MNNYINQYIGALKMRPGDRHLINNNKTNNPPPQNKLKNSQWGTGGAPNDSNVRQTTMLTDKEQHVGKWFFALYPMKLLCCYGQ